jgi:hypothetical protein
MAELGNNMVNLSKMTWTSLLLLLPDTLRILQDRKVV